MIITNFYIVLTHCCPKCFTVETQYYHLRLIAISVNSQVYREECMPSFPLQEIQWRCTYCRYLWNRPKQVVSHCRASITKAEDIPLKDVTMSSEGTFSIRRQTEKGYYELTFGDSQEPPACQCLSWQWTWLPCKHFFAVFRHYPNWQWNQLSPSYINVPRLTLDEAIITTPGFDNVRPQAIPCSKETRSQEKLDTIDSEREKLTIKPSEEQCQEMPV